MRTVVFAVAVAACAKTNTVTCPDGRTCPADTECYTADDGTPLCLVHDQLTSCKGMDDGATCAIGKLAAPGLCHASVCLPTRCGDGFRRDPEQCDGTELGSASDCTSLGYYYSAPLTCNAACSYDTSACSGRCGDGIVSAPFELCDGAPPAISCSNLGYGAGFLNCNACGPGLEECRLFDWEPDAVSQVTQLMVDVHGTTENRVFAVGSAGALFHYDGSNWGPIDLSACGNPSLWSVWTFPDSVLAGGSDGTVYRMTATACTAMAGAAGASTVTDLWAAAENDVYAVSGSGVYHYDGSTWSSSSSMNGLARLWGSGPDDVYAVGNADPSAPSAAAIHKTAVGWSTVPVSGFTSIAAVWGTSASDVYVGGWAGTSTRTAVLEHFNGITWASISVPETMVTAGVATAGHLFVAGQLQSTGYAGVLDYDGTSWIDLAWPSNSQYPASLWQSDTGALFGTVGDKSRIYKFPGAIRFDDHPLGNVDPLKRLAVRTSAEVYAVSDDMMGQRGGQIYFWNGVKWAVDTGALDPSNVFDVSVAPDGAVYVLEALQGLRRRTGAGTWSPPETSYGPDRVFAVGSDDVWLVTNNAGTSSVAHWLNKAFTACSTCAFPATIEDIAGTGPSNVWIVGVNGLIAHWNGSAWTTIPPPPAVSPTQNWWAVGTCGNDVFIGGTGGTVAHYDGTTWSISYVPATINPTSISCTSADDVFLTATSGFLFWLDRHHHWSPVKAGTNLTVYVVGGAGDVVFSSDQEGQVHRLIRATPW